MFLHVAAIHSLLLLHGISLYKCTSLFAYSVVDGQWSFPVENCYKQCCYEHSYAHKHAFL